MHIYLELLGYLGTAIVLISMMMTSVVKLRIFNIAGSVINVIYASLSNAWPVVFLNAGLILINAYGLLRLHRMDVSFYLVNTRADNPCLQYYLDLYAEDIQQFFPSYQFSKDLQQQVYIVYNNTEAVGLMIGKQAGETLHIALDYTMPKYRNCSVAKYLFAQLKKSGLVYATTEAGSDCHNRYLVQMGFVKEDNLYKKHL